MSHGALWYAMRWKAIDILPTIICKSYSGDCERKEFSFIPTQKHTIQPSAQLDPKEFLDRLRASKLAQTLKYAIF